MIAPSRVGIARTLACVAALAAVAATGSPATACPFCSAVSLTFSEEIGNSQVAVIGKMIEAPPRNDDAALDVAKAKFEIVKVLKGGEALGQSREIEAVYFGDSPVGSTFLIMGIDPPAINWSTPIAIGERGVDYVTRAMELPPTGPDRLVFFQDYLEDEDDMLARDAYDEFAKAPYSEVLGLKDRMHHDKLVGWVQSSEIPVSRRRLYLTMLGAYANPDDVAMFEEMIKSKDRQTKGALDALVAAYLTLKGPEGMPLVEELFLSNQDAEYTDTYATIMALRFHGTEEKIIPRERLLAGLRLMLDRPQLADLVIPDLARWEDWSVMDKLVELFKTSDDESSWVRVPVINYLRACPLPEAAKRIDELAKIDPDSIKRANSFFPFGAAAGGTATADSKSDESKKDDATGQAKQSDDKAKEAATSGEAASAPAESKAPAKNTQGQVEAPAGGETVAKSNDEVPASEPAASEPAASEPAEPAEPAENDVAAGESAAANGPRASSPDKKTAVLAGHLARDAGAVPGPPKSSLPVFGGLTAAAVLLACAFWAILKGGQHVPG